MKKLPFILFLLFFSNTGYSQFKIDFEVNAGSPGNSSYPSGFIEVGDDLVTIENTSGNNYSQTDLKIIDKSTGSLIYSEVLSNSYDNSFNIKKAVTIEDHQGYYFVINVSGYDSGNNINSFRLYNYTNSSLNLLNTFTNSKSDLLYSISGDLYSIDLFNSEIQKINPSNFSIEEQIPLSFSVNDLLSTNLLTDDDGNFILEAWEKVTNFNYNVFLSKFNIEGQILWEKTIGGNNRDFILDMKTKNGDIYLCGESKSTDGIFADQYGSGVEWGDEPIKSNWVLKLNTNGEIVWNKLFGTISGDYSSQTGRFTNIFIEDDYLFVSGSTYNKYDYYSSQSLNNVDNQDVIAVKLDLEGNTIWKKSYGGFNNQKIQSAGISNGQIIYTTNLDRWAFGGHNRFYASQGDVSAETSGKFNNPLIYQPGGANNQGDIWMFATNFDGEILWDNFYGGERTDTVSYSIYNSESIFMYGNTQSTGYDVGELLGYMDSWLFKLVPNNTPIAIAQTDVEATEQVEVNITLEGTDLDSDELTYIITTLPTNGTLSDNGSVIVADDLPKTMTSTDLVYISTSNTAISDNFIFKVNDGTVDSEPATVSIAITAVNDAPNAIADIETVLEDAMVTNIDVITNDTDPEDDTLILTGVSSSGSGTVDINADGISVDYTPPLDFNGTETITYTVSDGLLTDTTGTLTITVTAVNDAPVVKDHSIIVDEQGIVSVLTNDESTLLYNSSDIENDALTAVVVAEPNNGTLVLNSDGTFSYEHNGNETIFDSFTYKANDGDLDSENAIVTITINPVNDNSPSDIILSNNTIVENSSDITIGELTAIDLDLPTDSHTFVLVEGIGDDYNSDFLIEDNRLVNINSFDFETEEDISIRIKVTDENNTSFEKVLIIRVLNANDINLSLQKENSYCSGNTGTGSITITSINETKGDLTFSWTATNGGVIPSGQSSNRNLTNLSSGIYNLEMSDSFFTYEETVEIEVISQYEELSICYVSSDDTDETKNRIFLNNAGNYNVGIYEILRETNSANIYTSIGSMLSSENSFLDENSNNMSQSYNYKVRLIDYCGNQSPNSDFHKTILLQSSVAVNNSVNLNWSDYEGTDFSTYNIFRNTNSEGFNLIGSVSASNNSFNDADADITIDNYEYYISISVDECLNDVSGKSNSKSSTEIKSNRLLINNGTASVDDFNDLNQLVVFPNPSNDMLNIKLSEGITLYKVKIYNILGQMVLETQDLKFPIENLASSTYFIKIFTSKGLINRNFIKN